MRSSTGRHASVDLSACESSKPSAYGRSAKPWGSFRDGAANLDKLASDSRISKATRVVMLASFFLMTMTRTYLKIV